MSAVLPAQSKTDQSKIHQKRWKVEEVCAMKWTARSQQLFHRFRTEEFGTCPQVCAAVAASRLLRFVPQLQGTNLWKKRRAPGPSSLASLWPLLSGSILSSVGENGTELIWADSVSAALLARLGMVASSMFAISLKTGPWRPSPFDDAAPPARSLLFHSQNQTVPVPTLVGPLSES